MSSTYSEERHLAIYTEKLRLSLKRGYLVNLQSPKVELHVYDCICHIPLPLHTRTLYYTPIYIQVSIRTTSELSYMPSLSLQALTCFADAVRTHLNDVRGIEATGLTSQVEQVKVHLNTVVSFCKKSVGEDPSMLEYAARDLAFSMAHVYISKSS